VGALGVAVARPVLGAGRVLAAALRHAAVGVHFDEVDRAVEAAGSLLTSTVIVNSLFFRWKSLYDESSSMR
jgi:hypothetical protein